LKAEHGRKSSGFASDFCHIAANTLYCLDLPYAETQLSREKMKKIVFILIVLGVLWVTQQAASAHFGMIIPTDAMVMPNENRVVTLALSFSHPFEGVGMELLKPSTFGALINGRKQNLLDTLKETKIMNHTAWRADYRMRRPGAHLFFMEPQPFWEPAEDIYVIHYTKTVVAAFGSDDGWSKPVGLKTEIVPLSRPFGLYAGNVFQGIVVLDGKPVPNATVEVEYYNEQRKATAPTDFMITQTIKADLNGVFTYAAPTSGWWGFAALNEADFTIKMDGVDKAVEIGAVIWVQFHDWRQK